MKRLVAAAILAVLVGGCIEIAHVDSFVTLPKDMVSFGVQENNERSNNE